MGFAIAYMWPGVFAMSSISITLTTTSTSTTADIYKKPSLDRLFCTDIKSFEKLVF